MSPSKPHQDEPRAAGPRPEAGPESGARYKCPLCGCEFDASDKTCSACPMARTCNVVCCPNCGYGFARDSRLVGWLKKLFGKDKKKNRERIKE